MIGLTDVRGGIEFEFASNIGRPEFAAVLAKTLKIKKRSIRVSDDYINSENHDKDYSVWGVEYDSSIPTDNKFEHKIELVSPTIELEHLEQIIEPVFELIKTYGKTTLGTGMHITMSLDGRRLKEEIDPVKFMMLLDEQYFGEEYGRSEQHRYARSQIPLLVEKIKHNRAFNSVGEAIADLVNRPHRIGDGFFDYHEKKMAVNFSKIAKNVIEFRLPGGEGYHLKIELVHRTIRHFATALVAACDRHLMVREYVSRLARTIEDARPSTPDPLHERAQKREVKLIWLKKRMSNGRMQHTLCDITDGEVQQTTNWADRHFVVKIITKKNKDTGVEELLGAGDGSGWNDSLVDNLNNDKAVEDRRMIRILEHADRSKHKPNRVVVAHRRAAKLKSTFYRADRVPSSYYDAIVSMMCSKQFALPSNHMARGYIGIDLTNTVVKRLACNPSMAPYLSWYYADAIFRQRATEFPADVLYYAVRQKVIGAEELAELALAYIVPRPTIAVPRVIFYRAVKERCVVDFVRAVYAGMKHYDVKLDSLAAKTFVEYGTKLAKFPSQQLELIQNYTTKYLNKSRARMQPIWKPVSAR